MKFSLNLGQYYSNVDFMGMAYAQLVTKAGAQLGGIEEVIDWAPKFEGVIVAKIVSCIQHPNADRLHVCMVDDGGKAKDVKRDESGLVQVVCGAPNAREGIYVAWLPPGSTVPSSRNESELFILEARELRGVVSNGMLASAKELGISNDHDGILEIDPKQVALDKAQIANGVEIKPGDPLIKYFGLDDFVLDFENKMFTHRPDCFGQIGIARELAGIYQKAFISPSWYLQRPDFRSGVSDLSRIKLEVKNEAGDLVPRLMAVAMSDVTVGPSPVWLQAALTRLGMKSINNVVDVTNYVMNITGQPLHAYDADKLQVASSMQQVASIAARMAKKGEKVALLNGKTIELTETDIVIATDSKVVGLAGIMGGTETEVDANTKNIVIECATFDMYTIRRSSMHHGLFTDASTRYTKGQSPLQNDRAVWYAIKYMQELAGAKQSSAVYDVHEQLEEPADVVVTAKFINDRLGGNLTINEIAKLLENVEFVIKNVPADKEHLHIKPPFWRTDIEIPEDIVEEIGRLHGYEELPVVLPTRPAKPTDRNSAFDLKQAIRSCLVAAGANEVLTYSFVHGDLMRKTGTDPDALAYHVRNALSPDLQYYRTNIMPSLLDKLRGNLRADYVRSDDNEFAIFEIGKAHIKGQLDTEKLPVELERLALVFVADDKTANRKYKGSAFYQVKNYLNSLALPILGFVPLSSEEESLNSCYQAGRSASIKIGDKTIGVIGEFSQEAKKILKLPEYSAGFEIDINVFSSLKQPKTYKPVGIFPRIQADITFEIDQITNFADVSTQIGNQLISAKQDYGYIVELQPRDIFKIDSSDKKRLTFRMWLSHPDKTLKTSEVNSLLDRIAIELQQNLGAERI
jgi:phenylalanyl-tRNA synthetase beta chain